MRDPATIEQRADAEIPLQQIIADWPVGTDPEIHVAAIGKLFDSGVSILNVLSGQQDQQKVSEFYGEWCCRNLPALRRTLSTDDADRPRSRRHPNSLRRSARRFSSHCRANADAAAQLGVWSSRDGSGAAASMVAIER